MVRQLSRFLLFSISFCALSLAVSAQDAGDAKEDKPVGRLTGFIDVTGQYYLEDEEIAAEVIPELFGVNSYALLQYTYGDFTAGLRLESYLPVLNGFPPFFEGSGIGNRFVSWQKEGLEVTVGNFYEQFGNGMILRTFEERTLGLDNAFDGLRVRYRLAEGVYLKGLVAKERASFNDGFVNGEGLVRGLDAEVEINSIFNGLKEAKTRVLLGGSFVSKYNNQNNTPLYKLPENVGAGALRADISRGNFRIGAEYMSKANDPYPNPVFTTFDYIYKNGEAVMINAAYSERGLAIDLTARHTDNIFWRATNAPVLGNELSLGFIPAPTKQHTYNLVTSLYPYVTNIFGEVSFRADLIYKFKKNTALGGKYGTKISLSGTRVYVPERRMLNDADGERNAYTTSLFSFNSDSLLCSDIHGELTKKLSKKVKMALSYYRFDFDDRVQQVASKEFIIADIAVADVTWKFKKKQSLRFEAQHLWTDEHDGNWAFAQIEYALNGHLFLTVLDQYNYGNENGEVHFPLVNAAYTTGAHRFSAQYGRQRAGWFCVGGICRAVPASNGLTVTITSSF